MPSKAKSRAATVFVRNMPLGATERELTELFEEAGPVRRSIIIKKGDASRGFGFVQL